MKTRVAVITPVLIQTKAQQNKWEEQQYFLNNCDRPDSFTIKQFICGNVDEANVVDVNDRTDQVTRRRLLSRLALDWLKETKRPDEVLLLHWLDADDCPSAYWFHALRRCYHSLNILAVSERQLITFSKQYIFAGRRAFEQLAQGACGVGCGSAIVWRVDRPYTPPAMLQHLLMAPKLYQTYCGIEDVVMGVEVARQFPNQIGYVTADCCTDDCGQGLPAIYRNPSYTLGVEPDPRYIRNKLLTDYRRVRNTAIQGADVTEGYGK